MCKHEDLNSNSQSPTLRKPTVATSDYNYNVMAEEETGRLLGSGMENTRVALSLVGNPDSKENGGKV